ncbi:MAG: hypothetical protein ACXAEB_00200 [Candidatus Thorarchaeota archaeon]|jgi:phosphohistidine swiveling domain-containing protein
MTDKESQNDKMKSFPILRGESVGENGEFTGWARIMKTPEDLNRDWSTNEIAVLHHDLRDYFIRNPGDLDRLFSKVSAVLAEFGEAISEFAAVAYEREAIGVIKITDACHVLEDNMHIRVVAFENVGEIFFID